MSQPLQRNGLMAAVCLAVVVGSVWGQAGGPPELRDGFEGNRPSWKQEETDVTVNLLGHDRSDRAAHEGQRSERFHFEAGPGSALYYSYALPKITVVEGQSVQLYVRSDHAGIQLFGRVVLPADIDPDTGHPSFVLVPGSVYETADRWQRLVIEDVRQELERRVRILRAKTRRPVSLDGAYLDQLVANLYGGPGETVVYFDELAIAPAAEAATSTAKGQAQPAADRPPAEPPGENKEGARADAEAKAEPREPASARLKLERNHLFKDGHPWVFSAIRAPGADLELLLKYGCDVLLVNSDDDPAMLQEAARRGFLLMPSVPSQEGESPPAPGPADLIAAATRFPARDAVAFWNLGERLGGANTLEARKAERERVRALISGFHDAPDGFSHLTTAGVVGMFNDYARLPQNLDLMGVHPNIWGTTMEPVHYYRYLAQRRDLTTRNIGALFWTLIPTTPPEEVHQAVWGHDSPPAPAWGLARVQPEQVRMLTYAALAAGYRGIAFQAGAEITRAPGRAMLIELALLNAEIDLFEPILAGGNETIPLIPAFPPDPPEILVYMSPGSAGGVAGGVGSTSLRTQAKKRPETKPHPSILVAGISSNDNRSKLLVIADYSPGGQWQPDQMALSNLKIRLPGAPDSAQAYEITLGEVKLLDRERVPGGMLLTLPDFGPTALVLVTTDAAQAQWLESAVARVRSLAIRLAIDQARLQYEWVRDINKRLEADDHKARDASDLLAEAEKGIQSAEEALARASSNYEDYGRAWSEARRVGRPLRLLMRDHFNRALSELGNAVNAHSPSDPPPARAAGKAARPPKKIPKLVSPVSCPPLVAFNTLPQHYIWLSWIKGATWGKNLLPGGEFEDPEAIQSGGWADESYATEDVEGSVTCVAGGAGGSQRALRLTVKPTEGVNIDTLPPFLDHPAAAVRTPPVKVYDPVSRDQPAVMVRISVKVKMARSYPPGPGGLIVRDSLGGEPLQYRTLNPIPDWSELVLYRRAPAGVPVSVTLGLAGFGTVLFDDLKIQALTASPGLQREPQGELAGGTLAPPAPNPRAQPPTRRPAALAPATGRTIR